MKQKHIGHTMGLPPLFLERMAQILPFGWQEKVTQSFFKEKEIVFRSNALKVSPEVLTASLERQGFQVREISWAPGAFMLLNKNSRDLQETEDFKNGWIYIQNLSSMIPVLVLNPQPGEKVLDLTAAPGSKATQIAAAMKNQGSLVANDNSRPRFFKLKTILSHYSVTNVSLSLKYGETFGRDFPNTFDKVLLDAPCTTEGRFLASDLKTYQYWSLHKIKAMASKQKKLFASAFAALKPGGVMVYSTCAFSPEENEAVLDWALNKFKSEMELEAIQLPIPNSQSGLTQWQGKPYDPETGKGFRVIPDGCMEGFFVAKIHKKKAV